MEIVRLRPIHAESLITFFAEINTEEYTRDFSPFTFDPDMAQRICNHQGRDLYYAILMHDREVAGIGMLRGWDEGYDVPSIGLCILKRYQNRGVGTLMLAFLEMVLGIRGCTRVMLKVRRDNAKAKKLYEDKKYMFEEYDDIYLIGYKGIC